MPARKQSEPAAATKAWRVLTRIAYTHAGGDSTAGPGEVVTDLPDDQAEALAADGAIVEV
jgi:hypothetical protein